MFGFGLKWESQMSQATSDFCPSWVFLIWGLLPCQWFSWAAVWSCCGRCGVAWIESGDAFKVQQSTLCVLLFTSSNMFKGQAQESIRKPAGNKDDQAPKDWDVEVILSGKKKPQLLMTFSKVGICWLLLTFFWGKESLCVLTRGDGEQLHPDLQRILELELNDYHFLCPGYPGPGVLLFRIKHHRAMESPRNPRLFALDMISRYDMNWYDGLGFPYLC